MTTIKTIEGLKQEIERMELLFRMYRNKILTRDEYADEINKSRTAIGLRPLSFDDRISLCNETGSFPETGRFRE